MGIRRRNRPVSAAVAGGPFTPDTGPPDARPAGPCARDPPLPVFGELPELPTDRERAMAHRQGKTPHAHGKKERGDAATSPLPNAGLAKLVLVTASYVTCRSTRCLPLTPVIWKVRTIGTGRQRGIPRVSRDPACIPRRTRTEPRMPVSPNNPQDTQAVIAVLIAITACLCVAYWRTALRIILFVVLALAVFGVVAGIDGVTSLMAQHHR
jgi:hypothetical protein